MYSIYTFQTTFAAFNMGLSDKIKLDFFDKIIQLLIPQLKHYSPFPQGTPGADPNAQYY
jgi:hypothetical protein